MLHDVTLHLPAGSTVAIVGENGAGKTSLVKLLCRFYEPTAGSITVDGVDLRRFDVAEWRRRLSGGFQDFARVELTLQESVGIGDIARWTTRSPSAARWRGSAPTSPSASTSSSASSGWAASTCPRASGRRSPWPGP